MSVSDELVSEINEAISQSVESRAEVAGDGADGDNPAGDDPAGEDREERGERDPEGEEGREEDEGSADADGDGEGPEQEGEQEQEERGEQESGRPTLSDDVLQRAVQAGISLADARTFASDQSLLRVIDSVNRVAKPIVDQRRETEQTRENEEKKVDPLDGLPELDPEIYNPEIIATFETFKGVIRKQNEALKEFRSQQQEIAQRGAAEQAREAEQWFNERVNTLGEDFADALGTGDYGTLAPGSSQRARRDAIADQVAVLLAGYQASGRQTPPRNEVFDAAARLVLTDEFATLKEKKLSDKLSKRSKQHISRAGGKTEKQKRNPAEETAALLDRKFFKK